MKTGLGFLSVVGAVSAIGIPLSMTGSTGRMSEESQGLSNNSGGANHLASLGQEEYRDKWESNDLSLLSKVVLKKLREGRVENTEEKVAEIKREESERNEWKWVNKDKWVTERTGLSNHENDENLNGQVREALEYVLQEWVNNQWSSSWNSNLLGTSWTEKSVLMTGKDLGNKKNILLKFQLKDSDSKYIVGTYESTIQNTKGELALGLSGCKEPASPQCQIEKQSELSDSRIRIVFE